MKKPMPLTPVARRFIEDVGNTTQSFGMGRVVGQLYAYLYLSPAPRSLGDMQEALGISKGSASMGVRQLEQWTAARKIWVKGDRKDYYEATDNFGRIIKNAIRDVVGNRLAAYTSFFHDLESELEKTPASENGDREFVRQRIEAVHAYYEQARSMWETPMFQKLLQ
jgi:DNA-binding transcriptional regulator GbsR (MarR family)